MAAKKKSAKKAAKKVAARGKATAKKAAKATKKVARRVQPIPAGYHAVTPFLVVRGAADAIDFYKRAFGAKEKGRMPGPGGSIMHAEIQIGDSRVMLSDEFPDMGSKAPPSLGGSPCGLLIYTRDVDGFFSRAVAAGAKVTMPVADMFWGDRYGKLEDPFGHAWAVATHKEDLSPKEMGRRATEAMAQMGPPPAP